MQNLHLQMATCSLQTWLPYQWQPASTEVAKMHAIPYIVCEARCKGPKEDVLGPLSVD